MKTRYTIHKHSAKRAGVHYDLRLQKGNDVYSFALPKMKLPETSGVILAIYTHVDKKNLDILKFSGRINDGEYGAGTIEIVETGFYDINDWDEESKKIILSVPHQYTNQIFLGQFYLIQSLKNKKNYIFGKKKNNF